MGGYAITYSTKEGRELSREEVEACVKAIKEIVLANQKVVQIEFKDRKCCNRYNINFNGKGKNAHETFVFYSKFKVNPAEEIIEALDDKHKDLWEVITARGRLVRCTTATARQKYDKIVKQALMKCQEITDNAFNITCDDGFDYFKDKIVLKTDSNKKEFKTLEELRKSKLTKYEWK